MTITGCSFIGSAANVSVNESWNKLAHIAGGSNYIRNVLIENCSDEEAAALLTTFESVLRVLRKQNAGKVEEKKSLSPL